MQVNRQLDDERYDRLDHVLGRPVDPTGETYRDHFAAGANTEEAREMAASPHWHDHGARGDLHMFSVTDAGREALKAHLADIGDKHRMYEVIYDGIRTTVAAESLGKARYTQWLDFSDTRDIPFRVFCVNASVRAVKPATRETSEIEIEGRDEVELGM